MKKSIRFVGLDVHKDSISVAVAEDGRGGEVRYMGTIGTTTAPSCDYVTRPGRAAMASIVI